MSAQNTNGTENVTMEQILAAINGVNTKIDTMQKDMINLKKRQDDTDERFKKMQSVINDAVEEEKKASSSDNQLEEIIKDKIKGTLKFIIPAGVVLTAAGGALAYAIYKNKNASIDTVDDVDVDDVLDM